MKPTLRQKMEAKRGAIPKPTREQRRAQLIQIVKRGISDVGAALAELRDDEHWKDTHTTFAEFCRDNFAISKTYLYDVIKGFEVMSRLTKPVQGKITNESQTRVLARMPESEWEGVILRAEKNGGLTAENLEKYAPKRNVTSPVTKSAIADSTLTEKTGSETGSKRKEKVYEYDDIGTVLTDDALPYWKRRQEVQDLITSISKIKTKLIHAKKSEDPMYASVSQSTEGYLEQAYAQLKEALPYAVCTQCMGHPSLQPTGCSACRNKGLISKWHWWRNSPEEVKTLRLISNKEHADKVGRPMPDVEMFAPDSTQR